MYAVALLGAMGIEVLLSDDTKLYGPHDTLCRELVTDVIPFAFYELLFLRYISSAITLTGTGSLMPFQIYSIIQ